MSALPDFLNGYLVGDRVWLFSRGEDGVLRRRQVPAEWSCFVRAKDVTEKLDRMIRKSAHVARFKREGEWLRICWRDYETRKQVLAPKGWFDANGIPTFEGDVSPTKRWFADNLAAIATPRRAYLDIETDSRVSPTKAREGNARILCWCVEGVDGTAVQGLLEDDTDDAERRLLNDLWRALEPFDQVVSWFGEGFDFPVIRARTKFLRAQVKDPKRWLYVDQLEVYERMNVAAESGDEKTSLALKRVQHNHLGKREDDAELLRDEDFDARGSWGAWASGEEGCRRLLEYNRRDTRRQRRIEEETGFLDILLELARIATIFPDSWGLNPVAQVDGYVLRQGSVRGEHFATRVHRYGESEDDQEKYKGAIVIPPSRQGIVKGVHVFDFSGMYPSIILSFNMSPETKVPVIVSGPIPEGVARTPTTRKGFALEPRGIIPAALDEILRLKDHWGRVKASLPPGTTEWIEADRKATAYKVGSNAFYGVLGSTFSRFFDRDIAEGTTQTGVWLIKETLAAALRERGMATIYGDTDSGFVGDVGEEEVRAFVAWANEVLYPTLLAECGVPASQVRVKLAYEKEFERIVFSSNAAGDSVKKRYVGRYSHYKGKRATRDSKPEVKGVEWKRGDASKIARAMQYDAIRLLMGYDLDDGAPRPKGAEKNATTALAGYGTEPCEDPAVFERLVLTWRRHVLEDVLPVADVRITKGLSQALGGYAVKTKRDGTEAAAPPHVRVARILAARGWDLGEGSKIDYVVSDGEAKPIGVVPAVDYTPEQLDRHYLWEKQVYPPTMRLLKGAFPSHDWEAHHASRPLTERQAALARRRAEKAAEPVPGPEVAPGPGTGPRKASRAKKAPVAQQSLFDGGKPAAPPPVVTRVTAPVPGGPVKVEVGDAEVLVEYLREVLGEHPGTRRLLFERNGVCDEDLSRDFAGLKVDGSDAMWSDLKEALALPGHEDTVRGEGGEGAGGGSTGPRGERRRLLGRVDVGRDRPLRTGRPPAGPAGGARGAAPTGPRADRRDDVRHRRRARPIRPAGGVPRGGRRRAQRPGDAPRRAGQGGAARAGGAPALRVGLARARPPEAEGRGRPRRHARERRPRAPGGEEPEGALEADHRRRRDRAHGLQVPGRVGRHRGQTRRVGADEGAPQGAARVVAVEVCVAPGPPRERAMSGKPADRAAAARRFATGKRWQRVMLQWLSTDAETRRAFLNLKRLDLLLETEDAVVELDLLLQVARHRRLQHHHVLREVPRDRLDVPVGRVARPPLRGSLADRRARDLVDQERQRVGRK